LTFALLLEVQLCGGQRPQQVLPARQKLINRLFGALVIRISVVTRGRREKTKAAQNIVISDMVMRYIGSAQEEKMLTRA
jgi:hypothetical protein